MSNPSKAELFVQDCVTQARTMPLPRAIEFLGGLLELAGDAPEVAHARKAFTLLSESDRQLELIASGQLKLTLGDNASRSSNPDGQ